METPSRQRQIEQHLEAIRRLQAEPTGEASGAARGWPPDGYYLFWHILGGLVLGMIAAAVSLGFNAAGAPLAGHHPLELIRVYLTFPMGERALTANEGHVLTVGCILYLVTGGVYGILFHLFMSAFFDKASTARRFAVATACGLAIWVVNFYGILSWLQPMLLGGNWIITRVPIWVAAATHLVFVWCMLLIDSWGRFDVQAHRH